MTDIDDLYHALIVAHDRAPHNHGPLADATAHGSADNPLCGDEVTIHLALDGDTVRAASFEGRGCALSRAAASILTTMASGRTRADLHALATTFESMIASAPGTALSVDTAGTLGHLTAFSGVRAFRSRHTCALLPFRALATALR